MSPNALFLLAATLFSTIGWAQAPPPAAPAREFPFGPPVTKTVDPNQVLNNLESDLKELMAQNDKKMFGLSPDVAKASVSCESANAFTSGGQGSRSPGAKICGAIRPARSRPRRR